MANQLFDLTDRVAVVSGAAQGMGRQTALAFAEAGADLVLVDRNSDGLEKTAGDIEQSGRRAIPVTCDVSVPEQIDSLYQTLDREFGRIDVLVNMAGDGALADPLDITLETVHQVFQNLVIGRFYCCQQAGRRMLKAGKGSIINTGSLASIAAQGRGHLAYSMAMGAVAQMTRELSTEWSGQGVRVNAILPAQVMNPHLQERLEKDPFLKTRYLTGLPIGRMGVPEDVRGVAVFLASDASRWVTGILLPMDGGNLSMNAGGSPLWWGNTLAGEKS